jgi:hypothetical protein
MPRNETRYGTEERETSVGSYCAQGPMDKNNSWKVSVSVMRSFFCGLHILFSVSKVNPIVIAHTCGFSLN